MEIHQAWPRPTRIAPGLHRESRSGHNFSRVLHQERQQVVLHRSQPNRLAIQDHHLLAKMHKQVFITIELLVQRWQKHYCTPKCKDEAEAPMTRCGQNSSASRE